MSKLLVLNNGRWVASPLVSGINLTRNRADLLTHALESELAVQGQVGQESHRRPAVVEHTARCPDLSRIVQIALESTGIREALSTVVQGRPAGM